MLVEVILFLVLICILLIFFLKSKSRQKKFFVINNSSSVRPPLNPPTQTPKLKLIQTFRLIIYLVVQKYDNMPIAVFENITETKKFIRNKENKNLYIIYKIENIGQKNHKVLKLKIT